MFSIAAINDTDSRNQWQPLAPTKEAQEFQLQQLYHDGLLRLQAKDYGKARELLEAVLKDPLVTSAQVENSASDGHLVQLRFLALKNLAAVSLQQGPAYYESALHCYLQAVEIDNRDSVVWNQLGTLACSMGSLSISRWAFEQGLVCSPNNWNCMEKLLEILIAIGDEVACLSVAELILRNWPSHSRALLVKNTIEESEAIPFTPRGIDKLEPKHVRLKFTEKRKTTQDDLDKNSESKKLKQTIELQLSEGSWIGLVGGLLEILHPLSTSGSESENESYRSGNVRVTVHLPPSSAKLTGSVQEKEFTCMPAGVGRPFGSTNPVNEKEGAIFDEQPQERRSSRLERLRSRKPGKEESDLSTNKDLAKVVKQFLAPHLVDGTRSMDCKHNADSSVGDVLGESSLASHCAEVVASSLDSEFADVIAFVQNTSNNYGAYHMAHLLLEKLANSSILYHGSVAKILELEKVTRNWGQERTPQCNLFISELYYDMGLQSFERPTMCSFMSEASYHLCKIIESVALEYPFRIPEMDGIENCPRADASQHNNQFPANSLTLFGNNLIFWIRFFWLSAHLSLLEGDKEKTQKELSVALALLEKKNNMSSPLGPISLPHCKVVKELTVDGILHEINLIEVDYLMKNSVNEMLEKKMHSECIYTLAPLLLSANGFHLDMLHAWDDQSKGFKSVELSALDVLIKSCELAEPPKFDVYLNSHRRKLHILLSAAGVEGISHENTPGFNKLSLSESHPKDNIWEHWNHLVAQEVKAISKAASHIKSFMNRTENPDTIPMAVIGDIQSLLLTLMCNISNSCFAKKSCGPGLPESVEQTERCYFIDAAIAFCKLQHLNFDVPIKSQIELVVAIHDMLAEFGICCAQGHGEEQDGTFLKLAIKHLLAIDMKLKSTSNSPTKGPDTKLDQKPSSDHLKMSEQLSHGIDLPGSVKEQLSDVLDIKMGKTERDETNTSEKDAVERLSSEGVASRTDKNETEVKYDSNVGYCPDGLSNSRETERNQIIDCRNGITEDEKEELELCIDNALDQCFYCLYGLNLRSDTSSDEELVEHKNTSQGDYQTKEQCADVFQYLLPYAKASSRTGLTKLRRVLRAIRRHFPQPPDDVLAGNPIDKFLDNPELCEDKLSEEAGTDGFLDSMMKIMSSENEPIKQQNASSLESSDPYQEVYHNLYYLLAQSEEISATDKWAGFILTTEGEEFVQNNANLFKYDLIYNPMRFESWQKLANIYDEEVDLLLNDGSKQINVLGWRKNASLPQRVDASRRRSRRCLLMTLALAKTSIQQGEIHELLALVYYDGLQNVVPFYDQRSVVPVKDAAWKIICQNSMSHFKKALKHKEDWSYAFYVGKLCEKLGHPHDTSFSYYAQAISLNPSSVDAFYRMHASRLKLLYRCGKQNEEALKVVSAHSFAQLVKETVTNILNGLDCESAKSIMHVEDGLDKFAKVWHLLYDDCLCALEICVEGDLKHFHKARYMLAQGLLWRGGTGDLEKAKEELSFCFKSSRSSFTVNMWEIDSMVKKGRRKAPGPSGNRRALEVNLAESSRKFITCLRKYILFYLELLVETRDVSTLERAYTPLKADKRFSLCLEDLVPLALGRYIKALILSIHQAGPNVDSVEHLLEKLFNLFLEQVNLWSDLCSLPELNSTELTESSLYGYLCQYIQLLERNVNVETLEGINEKIRKRLKNPKLSNSNCAKVYRHVSAAWCRSLVISMALITPLHSRPSAEIRDMSLSGSGLENEQLLCVDLQSEELWSSAFEDTDNLKILETKWNPSLSKIKNVIIKRVSDEDLEAAATLLRSSYNFYKDTSCALLPSGINLYMVPAQLATETYIQPGIDGVDILDMNTSRKLLLWAYSLLHGHCTNVSQAIKYCEENAKSRMRKGTVGSSTPPNANVQTANSSQAGGGKNVSGKSSEQEAQSLPSVASTLPETDSSLKPASSTLPQNERTQNSARDSSVELESKCIVASDSQPRTESTCSGSGELNDTNGAPTDGKERMLSATPHLIQCKNPTVERTGRDLQDNDITS